METKRGFGPVRMFVVLAFIVMVTVNVLAVALPLNGVTPDEVSNSYPNLFAPEGITFSIWGLIYLWLAAYVLYQLGLFRGHRQTVNETLLRKTGLVFSAASLINAAWIFSWHYRMIPLSMLLMTALLIFLIVIRKGIYAQTLSKREKFFIQWPFSIYFGWITVATIANATTLLVSIGWKGWGLSESVWTIAVLMTGVVIGAAIAIRFKDIAYGLTLVWAYTGILLRHLLPSGYNCRYPAVVMATVVCIALIIVSLLYVVFVRSRKTAR